MYYTIEGKRFLCILYVIGLLTGTFFINVSIKMNLFRVSDFLGFTEYVKTLEGLDSNAFFFLCMYGESPTINTFFCLYFFVFALCDLLCFGFCFICWDGDFYLCSCGRIRNYGNDKRGCIFDSALSVFWHDAGHNIYIFISKNSIFQNIQDFCGESERLNKEPKAAWK